MNFFFKTDYGRTFVNKHQIANWASEFCIMTMDLPSQHF